MTYTTPARGMPPRIRHLRRVIVRLARSAVLLATTGAALGAQEVVGTLRSESLDTPLAGVLITISLVRNDSTIVRTTTDRRGRFRARTGTDPVIVRALRIGQQPVELGRVTLRAGERRELPGRVPDRPVRLAAVNARTDNRCRQDPVDGSLVAQLFADARTALWQSRLTDAGSQSNAIFEHAVQRYDMRDRPVDTAAVQVDSVPSLMPFRSPPTDVLLERGFRELLPDNGVIWSAPDAELLTDDRLLAHYCLRLVPDSPTDPRVIGVAFEPARTRRLMVQVRGTLWLDRETRVLRRIEYGYRGIEPALARATPGGVIEYEALEDGVWFVSAWSIRMPVVGQVVRIIEDGPTLSHVSVTGVQVTRGQVVSLSVGGQVRYQSDGLTADAPASLVGALLAVRDSTDCPEPTTDSLGTVHGTLRDVDGQPMAGVLVRALWTETVRTGDVTLRNTQYYDFPRETFVHTGLDGAFELCDLPRGVRIEIVAGPSAQPLVRARVRLQRAAARLQVPLMVPTPGNGP
jgi:hypothetical protein